MRETETECEWVRGREKGRHRIQSRLQAPSCQHRARRGARTHGLWDHDLSWSRTLNRLSHPGAPTVRFLTVYFMKSQLSRETPWKFTNSSGETNALAWRTLLFAFYSWRKLLSQLRVSCGEAVVQEMAKLGTRGLSEPDLFHPPWIFRVLEGHCFLIWKLAFFFFFLTVLHLPFELTLSG